jgi:hypothetical protein
MPQESPWRASAMMVRLRRDVLGFSVLVLVLSLVSSEARAQFLPGGGAPGLGLPGASQPGMGLPGTTPGVTPSLANPYTNPYLNPYLNPIMMSQPNSVGRNNALLYMWGAQQAPGGLLASPPLPGSRTRAAERKPAEMPRSSMLPGGSATSYFQRGAVANDKSRVYYQRKNRYFGNNGR